jgi:HWE histidine kinase
LLFSVSKKDTCSTTPSGSKQKSRRHSQCKGCVGSRHDRFFNGDGERVSNAAHVVHGFLALLSRKVASIGNHALDACLGFTEGRPAFGGQVILPGIVREGRIRALANVHTLFVQSRWTGAELQNLVMQELLPYFQNEESRARAEGPNLLLEPSAAQSVAVTLHELATNAAKYGALSGPNGHVHVAWSRGADGRLVLRWTETGGPPVKPPTRRGFGTRLMERMIRGQLNGDVCFDWRAEGLACEISLSA